RPSQPSPAPCRIGPDTHQLHGVRCDGRELALRYDASVDDAKDGSLLLHELADALPISDRIAVERIDADLLLVHRSASGDERIEIAHRRVTCLLQIREVEPAADRIDRLTHPYDCRRSGLRLQTAPPRFDKRRRRAECPH